MTDENLERRWQALMREIRIAQLRREAEALGFKLVAARVLREETKS